MGGVSPQSKDACGFLFKTPLMKPHGATVGSERMEMKIYAGRNQDQSRQSGIKNAQHKTKGTKGASISRKTAKGFQADQT